MGHGKKYANVAKLVDRNKVYTLKEACELVKQTATAKFDETVELTVCLGIDPKQAEQSIRGAVVMPHGTGKSKRVLVVAKGEKIKEAEAAKADFVGAEDMIEKIAGGWLDFDVIVATPDIMKDLSKVGKVLGPKGLMPNPKIGTVTFEVGKAVGEIKKGKVEYRADASAVIHSILGKVSFAANQLEENAKALIEAVVKAKPATAKGHYIKSMSLCSTMGPGIKLDSTQVLNSLSK
ncbi:MAG: 50S ribosomal protein L1 [bacterium]|nr:50S ribosomal protein L1 [bacterium]